MVTVSRLEAPSECLRQAVIRGWRRWVPITALDPTTEEALIAHRVELTGESISVGVLVDREGPIATEVIAGGGTSLRASHRVSALELQFADPAAAMLTVHAPDSPVAARTVALRTTN
jgi:hypothetical protein